MVSCAFKSIYHQHVFEEKENQTLMIDRFEFRSPFGIIGQFVNWLFFLKYMKNFLERHNLVIKEKLEA
jgi:ligand-binding SRPBCC domain-containing protein